MKWTFVAAVFLFILMSVVAGDERKTGTTPRDAKKLLMNRFGKLIDEEFERHDMSLENETANGTTPNASETEMVSFVDNSTQVGTNGTKKVNELEHVADGMLNATMENVQGVKMEDFKENTTLIASFVDDSTQFEKKGNGSTNLIELKSYDGEMVNHTTENATETKIYNSEEGSTQIESSFLAKNEKSIDKYVKVENNVMEFLNDASVNVTVENSQLTLFVKDDKITFGEQKLYVCFKSTIQSYASPTCPSGFCEVRVNFLSDGQRHTTYIDFDGHDQTFGGNSITAVISENSMKVTGVPNAPSPITTCNPDFDAGYLTVKVINKGGKTVRLSNVELHKSEQHEMETDMTPATIAGIAVGGFAILVISIM
uniref:Uncharacterized protein n=1 Tax=Panagrolaimus sp. JU765 TaxID=591449 RepID=A0AC34R9A7_9BILA